MIHLPFLHRLAVVCTGISIGDGIVVIQYQIGLLNTIALSISGPQLSGPAAVIRGYVKLQITSKMIQPKHLLTA